MDHRDKVDYLMMRLGYRLSMSILYNYNFFHNSQKLNKNPPK